MALTEELSLDGENIQAFKFSSYLLFKPEEIKNQQGSYFKVFTPFWKHCLRNWDLVKEPLGQACLNKQKNSHFTQGDNLELLPKNPNWAKDFEKIWQFERTKIINNFKKFLKTNLENYNENHLPLPYIPNGKSL